MGIGICKSYLSFLVYGVFDVIIVLPISMVVYVGLMTY